MSLTYYLYNDPSELSSQFLQPRMDLHESKENNQITATFELPGLRKEDVTMDVYQNRLNISGQSNTTNDLDKDGYTIKERRFGKFSRMLPLPVGVKTEEIQASMDNGVLTVRFPRTSPEQAAKRITIE